MKKEIGKIVFALLLSASIKNAGAQVWAEKFDKHPDLKSKGVYVVMNDTASETNKAYWNIYKKFWTCSPVHFLSYPELGNYLVKGNYFFTIMRYRDAVTKDGSVVYNNYSLQLWEYTGKSKPDSLRKEKILNGELSGHVTALAGVQLFSTERHSFYNDHASDARDREIPSLKFYTDGDYDGVNHDGPSFFNWNKGLLKNYLQSMQWYGEPVNNVALNGDIFIKEKMDLLKKDTLFIPEFALTQYTQMNGGSYIPVINSKNQNPKIAFRNYKFHYKVISAEKLSEKILNDPKPFFYFSYAVANGFKIISILNSERGEKAYDTWSTKGNYTGFLNMQDKEIKLEPKDIEILIKKMMEK